MLKYYPAYSGLRRIFLGFFAAIFLGVNTGSFLLYTHFSSTLLRSVNDSSLQMLEKIQNGTELMYRQMVSLMVQLASWDVSITKVMFETGHDRLEEYRANQIMQKAVVTYPYISYIAIYNERMDTIIATKDLLTDTRDTLKDMSNQYFRRSPHNLSIPIAVKLFSIPEAENTVTLIIYSPLSMENDKGVLLLGISCDYFTDFIHQMDEGDRILILHGNGQVITHPDAAQQLADYSGREYVARIQESELPAGYFLQKLEDEETYFSYIKNSELDWTFISMAPYKKIMAPLRSLRARVLLITLSILCAAVLVSYLLAVHFYRPMHRLLRQSEYLVRSKAVLNLLKNQYADTDAANARIIDAAFREPFYAVCLIVIDSQDGFEKLDVKAQGAARNRIITIATEKLNSCATAVDHAIPYRTEIAFVLHLEDGRYPPLDTILAETCDAIQNGSSFRVSAVAGPMVNSIFAIGDSYEETEKLLPERFFMGRKTVSRKELFPSRQDGTALRLVNDALEMVRARYSDPLFSVNTAAEHFNITSAYFNRIFKKQKGCSFSEYLNEYRLEIACTLLTDTNQAVGAIASAVGISNATYFFTLFKKIYNQTPLEFRIYM